MKLPVLIAQAIFALIGAFFTICGIMGQLTFRPSLWYSGPQPIVLIFIGLTCIAVTFLLTLLHKRNDKQKETQVHLLQMAIRCPNCGSLNNEKAKYCNDCGASLLIGER